LRTSENNKYQKERWTKRTEELLEQTWKANPLLARGSRNGNSGEKLNKEGKKKKQAVQFNLNLDAWGKKKLQTKGENPPEGTRETPAFKGKGKFEESLGTPNLTLPWGGVT